MQRLSKTQIIHLFQWSKRQVDQKGRDLLERARLYLLQHPQADKYETTAEILEETTPEGFHVVQWSCSCPQGRKPAPCKHVIALIILQHRDILEQNAQWSDFFQEYDKVKAQQMEKWLEDFGNF